MKKYFIVFLLSLAFLQACKNDVQLNAAYKEIIVVYGLLDINDSVHYIRIQKAFQNTGTTAQSIAQKPDSLYFDSLLVTITDLTTNKIDTLTKETSIIKDSGYFQNKVNILYRFSDPLFATHRYRLDVKNIYTGNRASSITSVVGNATNITGPPGDTFDLLAGKKIKSIYRTGINARAYDIFYRFKYDEIDSVTNNLLAHQYFDYYVLRSGLTGSLAGGEAMEQIVESNDILNAMGNALVYHPGVTKVATNLDACYAGAADDLNVYLDVSKPSIGIVQKKPEYTNINNGYGIFSSRSVFFKKHPVSFNTQETVRNYSATKNLGWK